MRRDRLGQAGEARHRPFLRHEERRVDVARRVVHRHDQVDVMTQRRDPAMRRAILEQHHPRQRTARPLLAMFAPTGGGLDLARGLQRQPRRRVAQRVVVAPAQVLVEMLHREVGVFLAIETAHAVELALRRAPVRHPAEAPVAQSVLAFLFEAAALATEMTRRQVEQLAGLLRRQTVLLETLEYIQEARHIRLPQDTGPTHAWSPEQTTNRPDNSFASNGGQLTRSRHTGMDGLAMHPARA